MSIYKRVLGKEFYHLHPMLQHKYELLSSGTFSGSGVMKKIKGGPKWLYPMFYLGAKWKLLFPESGENIPFTITNTSRCGENGERQVHWERIFYFKGKRRYFNALMSFDQSQNVIKDYLGEPPLFYSDLVLKIDEENRSLRIESKGQRLVFGKREISLPRFLQGLAVINESYSEEKGVFQITVGVKNPLVGWVFYYEGEFKQDELDEN
ncbi:DUF4166 domain-containing protein [Halobacillus salinarum]|uniref:DUF4166 domain-containing protein n=1 Tax=Halobacillus salinarum TaxID=2932257 RepID=A0ABY4EMC3_9BACI|nr:DUF4166 domain-containing protein [Halobacillus salinarum]UOQ45595.1 DUF4166 domain-containing protein [Halobacillus salinarum]